MSVVYFAHSYRKEDAHVVQFFLTLMEEEGLTASLDPPSDDLNLAKPQRHLLASDAMIAVLTRRGDAVSSYILFEIELALRARKPLLILAEDTLPTRLLGPSTIRILTQRFSRRHLIRQIREHRHALRILQSYLGEHPAPKYGLTSGQRACLLLGWSEVSPEVQEAVAGLLQTSYYEPLTLDSEEAVHLSIQELYEALARCNVTMTLVDSLGSRTQYLQGLVAGYFIPSIQVTAQAGFSYSAAIPKEYQARFLPDLQDPGLVESALTKELLIYEQDYLDLGDQDKVARYTEQLIADSRQYLGSDSRAHFREVIMGDKYEISGQAGAIGPSSHAENMTFIQTWNQIKAQVDLQELLPELEQLRQAMKAEASDPDHDIAVAELVGAQRAAEKGDGPSVVRHLRNAGQWALGIAVKIGVPVAVEALKHAVGVA